MLRQGLICLYCNRSIQDIIRQILKYYSAAIHLNFLPSISFLAILYLQKLKLKKKKKKKRSAVLNMPACWHIKDREKIKVPLTYNILYSLSMFLCYVSAQKYGQEAGKSKKHSTNLSIFSLDLITSCFSNLCSRLLLIKPCWKGEGRHPLLSFLVP